MIEEIERKNMKFKIKHKGIKYDLRKEYDDLNIARMNADAYLDYYRHVLIVEVEDEQDMTVWSPPTWSYGVYVAGRIHDHHMYNRGRF